MEKGRDGVDFVCLPLSHYSPLVSLALYKYWNHFCHYAVVWSSHEMLPLHENGHFPQYFLFKYILYTQTHTDNTTERLFPVTFATLSLSFEAFFMTAAAAARRFQH